MFVEWKLFFFSSWKWNGEKAHVQPTSDDQLFQLKLESDSVRNKLDEVTYRQKVARFCNGSSDASLKCEKFLMKTNKKIEFFPGKTVKGREIMETFQLSRCLTLKSVETFIMSKCSNPKSTFSNLIENPKAVKTSKKSTISYQNLPRLSDIFWSRPWHNFRSKTFNSFKQKLLEPKIIQFGDGTKFN